MKQIDGQLFKQMIISAANNLYNHYPEIDALNVFPVPDGDTGMNMNLTLSSGAKEVANRNDEDIYAIATAFSKGLLMGARGNSGVITSQIFRGFAKSLEGKKEIKPLDLAEAFVNGKEVAYKAVMRPVEGTILTVVRESSQFLLDHVEENMTIEKAMELLIQEAKASLERTPELLPVLKEVGVVDSGGAGLVTIFEGMQSAVLGEVIEKSQATAMESSQSQQMAGVKLEEEEYGYCTEFIMRLGPDSTKKPFVEKRFAGVLGSHGTSLVVVRDEDLVKVHVHTINPGSILNYAQQFGEFIKLKVENMTEQHSNLDNGAHNEHNAELLEQFGANEDLLKKKGPQKEFAIIAVSVGAGLDEIFKELGVSEIVSGGQTMNPSTEDFVAAIKKSNAKNVFILPNNSNIVMAASQACDVIDGAANAKVIPSKTIPQGIVSAMMFNSEISADDNFEEMKAALKTVKSGSVTYAIKDTDIEGVHVTKGFYMGIEDKAIVSCVKDKLEALYGLIASMVDQESAILTVILGEDVTEQEEKNILNKLQETYQDIDIDVRKGGQPIYSFFVGVE